MEQRSSEIQMELKYCERCGGLWLRLKGSQLVYCPSCAMVLAKTIYGASFVEQGDKCRPAELLQNPQTAFWCEGGNA